MAVSDSWLGNAEDPKHWRDIMFKVTGPMARSLQDSFVDHWASSSGEILLGRYIYPEEFPDTENSLIKFIHIAGSPADDSQPIPKFLLLPMLAAQEQLYIATPYFVGNKDLMSVLKDKAQNGVDVKILLPGKNIDYQVSRWGSQNYYDDLLEAGVKIYEYQPTFTHSKFIVVDNLLSVIGSPNLNSRSRRLDEENAMAIFDATLAQELTAIFIEDLTQAEEIDLESWRKRNPLVRTLQLISRLFTQQS
jgi:cardiolipin synthase